MNADLQCNKQIRSVYPCYSAFIRGQKQLAIYEVPASFAQLSRSVTVRL